MRFLRDQIDIEEPEMDSEKEDQSKPALGLPERATTKLQSAKRPGFARESARLGDSLNVYHCLLSLSIYLSLSLSTRAI